MASSQSGAVADDEDIDLNEYDPPASSGVSETSGEGEDDLIRDASETPHSPLHSPHMAMKAAFANFSKVATRQQRRFARAPLRLEGIRSRFQQGRDNLAEKVSGDKTMATLITIVGIVVFGGFAALSVYCIVLGGQFYAYPGAECRGENDYHPSLQTWLIVRGLATLLSTSLIIVAVVSRAQSSDESKVSRQSGRWASSGLGIVELFNFAWICAGTIWVGQLNGSAKETVLSCPQLVRDFVTYYVSIFWGLVGLVVILACVFPLCCTRTRVGGDHHSLDDNNTNANHFANSTAGDIDMVEFAGTDSLMEV